LATTKIKLDKDLVEQAEKFAGLAGYGSVEEFVEHLISKEIAKLGDGDSEEEVKEKLRGLGYIS